ncbi:hypothetical protein CP10139811_0246 [Chlamydia ibidis]|uniref:Uncharacterized protein n=2 Tax=Chlamydia ibidis TaxID=1405396 RepID=S7KDP7_9CHLA|nr:hypothetical protein CP10139811_0246 [Chlamydia ibidis]EQM62793.1 hypothetical protein H359_0694 [Chlamydia ibidis 10-1398/6]
MIGYFWIRKETLVERWLSSKLHTEVSVGSISPRLSGMKIRHLCIYNIAPHAKLPYAAEIEHINIRFSLISMLLSKKIEISDLLIHGANFSVYSYEVNSPKTNWFLLWKNFFSEENQEPSSQILSTNPSKLDNIPVFIKRCLFTNARVHNAKSSDKEISVCAIPSMEFHSNLTKQIALPNLGTAITSLLYLSVEEGLYHANLPSDIVRPLSKQAHLFFISSRPNFQEDRLLFSEHSPKAREEILEFVRDLFFH